MLHRTRLTLIALVALIAALVFALPLAGQSDTCAADLSAEQHAADGQSAFEAGDYAAAIAAFTCAIDADPQLVAAYRGRIDASLMSGAFSDALRDYTRLLSVVVPEQPDALEQINADYAAALEADPENIVLLTGYSFDLWRVYDHETAITLIETLNALVPDDVYGILFRGSLHLYAGDVDEGEADFARALELAPDNPHVHFIIADAYTYALGDLERAADAANTAIELGLDTPRLTAILATSYLVAGDDQTAATYFLRHIGDASSEEIETDPLDVGGALTLDVLPGRAFRIPVEVSEGETLTIVITSVDDAVDSLLVVLDSDGNPVTANDDSVGFNAGLDWTVPAAGSYTLYLTSFESAGTGEITVTRES